MAQVREEIVYDGSNLQAFIDNLPPNSIAIFSNDTLVTEETLIIQNKKNIHFKFNGFTLQSVTDGKGSMPTLHAYKNRWPRNRAHVVINASDSLLLEGLDIFGPHTNGGVDAKAYNKYLEVQHGIEIRKSRNVKIMATNISHIFGDGIYVAANSSNLEITNVKITHNGRQGIAIVSGHDILIEKCHIAQIRRASIDLEPNSDKEVVKNIRIVDNVFGPKRLNWIAAGSSKGKVSNIIVENNMVNAAGNIWIGNKTNKFRQGPWIFRGNTSKSGYGTPNGGVWRLIQIDGFSAEDNTINTQKLRDMQLIYATRCTDIELGENEVPNGTNSVKTFYDPKK